MLYKGLLYAAIFQLIALVLVFLTCDTFRLVLGR